MPGIWLATRRENAGEPLAGPVARAGAGLRHGEDFRVETVVSDASLHLGYSAHASYPIRRWEFPEHQVVLEGVVYGAEDSALEGELVELGRGLDSDDFPARAAAWIRRQDGDFVVVLLAKESGRFAVLNDALGRLPLYAAEIDGGFALAREVKFVASLLPERSLDRLGAAEHLVFGYPFGDRTLVRGVRRLPPGVLVRGNSRAGTTETLRTLEMRFPADGAGADAGAGARPTPAAIREHGEHLASLFGEACARRRDAPAGADAVLSLSGGLDSRSVAAGLRRADIPFRAVTFGAAGIVHPQDVVVARELAEALDVEWKLLDLGEDPVDRADRILRLKDGLNYTGMSFLLPFYDAIREAWGNDLTLWTGDGGDKLLPPLLPEGVRLDESSFVDTLVGRSAIFAPAEAERITGLEAGTLVRTLGEHFAAYPETDPASRFVAYYFRERGAKWLFEGEDRTRFFCWGTSPFWSLPLVEASLAIPQSARDGHELYAAFLRTLDPRLAAVRNARWGSAVAGRTSPFLMVRDLANRLPEGIRFRLKTALRSRQARVPADRQARLDECLARATGEGRVVSGREAAKTLRHGASRVRVEMLLTLAAYEETLGAA